MIKSNPVRELLQDGKPTIGTWVTLCPHPRIISLYAACGFDFVIIEMEHTDFGLDTVGPLLLTAREAGLTPFVRPPGTRDPHDLTRLLDSGAQGLVLPSIDTVEQIQTILAATKFHPMGHRPLNLRGPHTDYISGDTDAMTKHLNAHTLSVVMIESQTGVANLADICAVDGVDAIMIGPDDLSQDMGIPGELEHPNLLAVIDRIFETCKAAGTPCGLTSHTVEKATHWLGKGAQWLPYSNDAAMVFNAANAALPALKKAAGRD